MIQHGESALTVTFDVHFKAGSRGRKRMHNGTASPDLPPSRVPRVSRLMALAIRFEQLIDDGEVRDYADLARLGHVTRARMTQIMDLTLLAPDIQEELLFLPPGFRGRDIISERHLRPIVAEPDWRKQRKMWGALSGRDGATLTRHANHEVAVSDADRCVGVVHEAL